ncbi:type II toxin-antitoxin system death-on-curing family toxin [Thalassospira alkalitolerans]|uniref:Death-on-curing protein n=1 Tax=Thalassospira alkalitolerans TaxID=1293890 RepID=A0A1Y2LDW3_9PROT|nr:type II toxin-antitoxin system death-on-curing family toxin [Thalassospira alkalitolerans]OSQ48300.1 death-on-curing protein [Thalassospira alkalitolerans]
MTAPTWVTRVDVEAIHETMIEIGGGSYGLRDAALLESALARPQNLYAYGKTNIFLLAASYSEGIARNHPFIDGNKRTALLTADLFLADNGLHLNKAIGLTYVEMMERLGQGLMTRDEAADIFRMNCQPA